MSSLKKVKVVLFTQNTKIEGSLTIEEGFRVSDHLNRSRGTFIPLVNVKITDLATDKVLLETDFVCVNKNDVVIAKTEE